MSKSILADLRKNLHCGLRSTVFLPISIFDLRVSGLQLILLVVFNLLIRFLLQMLEVGIAGNLSYYNIPFTLFYVLVFLLYGYLVAHFEKDENLALAIPIALTSIDTFFQLLHGGSNFLVKMGYFEGDELTYRLLGYGFFVWWGFACFSSSIYLAKPLSINTTTYFILAFLCLALPAWFLPARDLWEEQDDDQTDTTRLEALGKEQAFYVQADLLNKGLMAVKPGRKGIADFYFIGFGSTFDEDVFRKEIEVVSKLFNERFDSGGRSINLINNPDTVLTTPIATVTSLTRALEEFGKKMNLEEDILFLYITTHGSKQHELSVKFWPLTLGDITPHELKRMLNKSRIKWKVIVISACYSGGFISHLKDDYTLIITSSDSTHASFGCGTQSEFTYFGQALFDQALRKTYSFPKAFNEAREIVLKLEKDEKRTESNPQFVMGSAIDKKLQQATQRLQSRGKEIKQVRKG